MRISEFNDRVRLGAMVLDGATESEMRAAGMPAGACAGSWIMAHPKPLMKLQRAYAAAGCDIICAPTRSAGRANLEARGLEEQMIRLNAGLVAMSREAAEGRALIAASVASDGAQPLDADDRRARFEAYREQIIVIAAADADLLTVELMGSVDDALCAVEAARDACGLPVLCALAANADGRLKGGGSAGEAAKTLHAAGASAVGLACPAGPERLKDAVAALKDAAGLPVVVRVGAGGLGPEAFAGAMLALADAGADVLGGCHGAGLEHIAALAAALRK